MKTQVFRLLCLGDVVGPEAALFLRRCLPSFRQKRGCDFVIVNGENAARHNGIDREGVQLLFAGGADVITTGNHAFRQREIRETLDGATGLLRPANFPGHLPGRGWGVYPVSGVRVLVANVQGTLFMEALSSPFDAMEKILAEAAGQYDLAFCDIHAEATSEKIAFARHFDGRLSAVFGTHTHVPTADWQILPGGTGYVTDLGMCGGVNSVLGIAVENAVSRFLDHLPTPYVPAKGEIRATGAYFDLDVDSGACLAVEPVTLTEESE
ncbi:MAG: YmdB family metallophosphoesterase [Clostridia bacterium]|nr:YmdB family metallophosphoesterase [Clostridia bacterium]